MQNNQPHIQKEHTISYASPSSPLAARFGKSAQGCWVYKSATRSEAVSFESDALLIASEANTTPSRWSTDHPFNLKFKPGYVVYAK